MYRTKGNFAINTVEDLLPIFNENTEMTVSALNILEKKVCKLSRKMKMNNITGLALWLCLFGALSATSCMLKQMMDIQSQRIDILDVLVKDTKNTVCNTVINTKDKDEEM